MKVIEVKAPMIRPRSDEEIQQMRAIWAFCAAVENDLGKIYVDSEGFHYVEFEGRWIKWQMVGLEESRP